MLRRRRRDDLPEATETEVEATPPADVPAPEPVRPTGPWDLADAPDDGRDRLDFGALRVWVPEDTDLRVDFGEQGELIALTLACPSPSGEPDALQVSAFAAPRRAGIWDDIRSEIAQGVAESGGRTESAEGAWGPELRARLSTDQPGVLAPARFLGVDGPRWFVRGLATGPAAAEGNDHPLLAEAFRALVVVRGDEAMPPREALVLRPPPELQEQMAEAVAQATAQGGQA